MNHFIICYAGNKRKEYKYLKEEMDFKDVKNIIEPFCGSSAISYNIWKEHGNKFNYYLNDKSKNTIDLYKLLKSEEPDKIEEEINKIKDRVSNKEEYLEIYKKKDPSIYEYIYFNRYRGIREGFYKEEKSQSKKPFTLNKVQLDFIKFVKGSNVYISNDDWSILYEKYKDDVNSIIMLDPPYLQSYNDFYQEKELNVYEYLYNNPINNSYSQIYLMLENIWIIKMIFKNCQMIEYDKIYETTKKKTTHIIIRNRD